MDPLWKFPTNVISSDSENDENRTDVEPTDFSMINSSNGRTVKMSKNEGFSVSQ